LEEQMRAMESTK